MQLNINTSQQQLQFNYTQSNLNQSAKYVGPQPQTVPLQDRIELSDDSRRPRDAEHAVERMRKGHHDRDSNPLFNFLKDILEKISGAQVNELKGAPPVSDIPVPVLPAQSQTATIAAEQSSLSVETSSISIGGSITTRDGVKFSFALDLQMIHASASSSTFNLSNGPGGYDFNFAGSSAELTSTGFNFSLTAELPDGTSGTANGLGNFSLKEDLKEVQHALKPYLKAFFKDSGMSSDNYGVKQMLQAIA
ncbi:MAG: hypothetical protein ACOYL3_01635 [Desulfuromonadaceae bacterium]